MPQKNKKSYIVRKKKHWKKRNPKIPKHIYPNVYYFNRSQVFDVNLGELDDETPQGVFWNYASTAVGDGRAAAVAQLSFNLQQLTDWTEFKNLFTFFKIPAVSFKVYCSTGLGGGTTRDNSQCIVYTMPYSVPLDMTTTADLITQTKEENFLTSQVCKKKLLLNDDTAKPNISMYMKLRQAIEKYDTSVNVPIMIKPKWIPFDAGQDPQLTNHYGLLQRIQSINNSGLPAIQMKVVVKYYLMMKRVR